MTPFRALARLALALLCAALSARAVGTFDESPIFAFDTRDSNSTHYGESNVFAFNTRTIDGQSGGLASGAFSFDTRNAGLVTLAVTGPPQIAPGQTADQAGALEQIERVHFAAQPLQRPAALGRVGMHAVIECRHDQNCRRRHTMTSAPRNCKS